MLTKYNQKGRDFNFVHSHNNFFNDLPILDFFDLMYITADMANASQYFPTNDHFFDFLRGWCEIKNQNLVMNNLRWCITDMKRRCQYEVDSYDQKNLNRLRELFDELIHHQPTGDNATHDIIALLNA